MILVLMLISLPLVLKYILIGICIGVLIMTVLIYYVFSRV